MKNSMKPFGWLLFMWLLSFSCQQAETKEDAKILQEPPFVAITDSINQEPENAAHYSQRGSLLAKQGFHELAGKDFQKAWELSPQESTALELGANLENRGLKKEALAFWSSRQQEYPTNSVFTLRLGKLFASSGQPQKALQTLKSFVEKDSTDFLAWFELGQLQAEQGDSIAAQKSLEKSYLLEPGPNNGLALAGIYSQKGDARIIPLCDQLLQGPEPMADALLLKGIYYSDKGDYSLAREQLDACIKLDYTLLDAHLEKGISYFREKNFLKAQQTFETALQVSKTSPDIYFWIGRCHEARKESTPAVENFERALSLEPNFSEAAEHLKALQKN